MLQQNHHIAFDKSSSPFPLLPVNNLCFLLCRQVNFDVNKLFQKRVKTATALVGAPMWGL